MQQLQQITIPCQPWWHSLCAIKITPASVLSFHPVRFVLLLLHSSTLSTYYFISEGNKRRLNDTPERTTQCGRDEWMRKSWFHFRKNERELSGRSQSSQAGGHILKIHNIFYGIAWGRLLFAVFKMNFFTLPPWKRQRRSRQPLSLLAAQETALCV